MFPRRNLRSVEAADLPGEVPPSGSGSERPSSQKAGYRGEVARLVNEREDQPGDRTGDAG